MFNHLGVKMEDFHRATEVGDIDYVKKYLEQNRISQYDIDYCLICSASNGHLNIVKYLVEEHQADIHADRDEAINMSACRGHLHVVKYLVEKGADIHDLDEYVLRSSACNGHLHVVKYLVSRGADIHARNEYALRWSAAFGHIDVVKYLVEKGADIHAENEFALKWSAENGHLDVVKYLVEKGANVNTTPLTIDYVVSLEVVKYLLSKGIHMNKLNTRLFTKCIKENSPEDAEFIAQYFSPANQLKLVPKKFHDYALKYGIVYQGSNYPPMEEEYKKRKEIRSKLKNEIYEKAQEILYSPGGMRFLLLEASKCVE